jgi:hypothetical protein
MSIINGIYNRSYYIGTDISITDKLIYKWIYRFYYILPFVGFWLYRYLYVQNRNVQIPILQSFYSTPQTRFQKTTVTFCHFWFCDCFQFWQTGLTLEMTKLNYPNNFKVVFVFSCFLNRSFYAN